LALASLNGHEKTVSVLLKNGADSNLSDSYGVTPLMYAARMGYIGATIALIKGGADINHRDKYERDALLLAKRRNHGEIIKLLQAADAK
jgi:ankyrin repeat protein